MTAAEYGLAGLVLIVTLILLWSAYQDRRALIALKVNGLAMMSVNETMRRAAIKGGMMLAIMVESFDPGLFSQRSAVVLLIIGVGLLGVNDLLTRRAAMDTVHRKRQGMNRRVDD